MDMNNQQAELTKLATEWANDDPKEPQIKQRGFKVSTNTSRATFEYVKTNPYKTRAEVTRGLEDMGYKRASVETLLTQMVQCDILRRDTRGLYYANKPAYTPVKITALRAARKKAAKEKAKITAEVKSVMKANQGLAALQAESTPVPPAPAVPVFVPPASVIRPALASEQFTINTFDADRLLSTLSFNQTIELYKKLKAMLGDL